MQFVAAVKTFPLPIGRELIEAKGEHNPPPLSPRLIRPILALGRLLVSGVLLFGLSAQLELVLPHVLLNARREARKAAAIVQSLAVVRTLLAQAADGLITVHNTGEHTNQVRLLTSKAH